MESTKWLFSKVGSFFADTGRKLNCEFHINGTWLGMTILSPSFGGEHGHYR